MSATFNFPVMGTVEMETEIRGAANAVICAVHDRGDHPSYGYTKSGIRQSYSFLQGLVGMYAFLTGQAMSTAGTNPTDVLFRDAATRERVAEARAALFAL